MQENDQPWLSNPWQISLVLIVPQKGLKENKPSHNPLERSVTNKDKLFVKGKYSYKVLFVLLLTSCK